MPLFEAEMYCAEGSWQDARVAVGWIKGGLYDLEIEFPYRTRINLIIVRQTGAHSDLPNGRL